MSDFSKAVISEIPKVDVPKSEDKKVESSNLSNESKGRLDNLFNDDFKDDVRSIPKEAENLPEDNRLEFPSKSESPYLQEIDKQKLDNLFKEDFEPSDNTEEHEPNSKYTKDGETYYTDDNGTPYKKNGELLPNTSYEINGYKYTTDDQGRIISAEGTLKLSSEERKTINEKNVGGDDKKDTDERGHLIADRFGGSNKIENLVAMDGHLNKSDYKKLEKLLADAVADGKEVTLKVEPVYEGDSKRPSKFIVTYTIDGEETVVVYKNEGASDE